MALAHRGQALTQARETDQAIPVLEKLLKTNPTDGAAYGDLGKDWEVEGQTEKAIEAYEHALAYDPNQISLHYRLFQFYRKVGTKGRAGKELYAFRVADPKYDHGLQQRSAALK